MKARTQEFKDTIKLFGRELDSIITYESNSNTIELGNNELNSVSPHYEGGILKSVMKVLDIDSNVDIPLETVINYQFGVKVRNQVVEDYRDNYDYIDFGNYVVYSSEKQEDTDSYKIICYDKMLYAMKDYEDLGLTYPITIRNYINAIATYMGIDFANINDTFANYDKTIPNELYLDSDNNSLGYTFRDVLDELAEVTASTICINDDDELEIRYITNSNDTINEEYLKDINVNFGESYGPINTIVLSRSAGSDNVYFPNPLPATPKEIKISDNQIMNGNNRADYLPDIYNKLNGLSYYLNDYSSTGICYYDLCDRYNVIVGETTYSCVMFNDDIHITQGLEENIYTDLPEESVTDYTKADSTDRRINQTYLIVDKQNQAIEGVVSQVDEQNEQIAIIRLQYNELISKISDIADITVSGESSYARVELANVNTSEPISIKIHPILESISYLYPYTTLYPSASLYPKTPTLKFTNTTTSEEFIWYLPTSLWYYNNTIYDELELSYGNGLNASVTVTRNCEIDSAGVISVKATPTTETYSYPTTLTLTDGDYVIEMLGYNTGYLYVQLMAKNIYTTQFYTKAETNSIISQTASSIDLSVDQKLSNYSTTNEMNSAISITAGEINQTVSQKVGNNEVISKINQTPEQITINANKLNLAGYVTVSSLSGDGTTTINGSNITTGTINGNYVNVANINASNITSGTINGNYVNVANLNASNITSGTLNGNNVNVTNLNANNITTGTINGRPYSYNSGNSNGGKVTMGDSNGPIMGYQGTSKRWSIASFTTGGRFQTFDSSGNMAAYFNQTGAHTSSDIRYKKNIKNIKENESINIINKLTPITYDYNDNYYHRGLSAQEVEKVLNNNGIQNQIYEITEEGKYTLNYNELIPDLINCIKYLNNKIIKLESESDK